MNKLFKILIAFIFALAIFLRAKVYLTGHSLWLDECSLAMSVINNKFVGALEYGQAAPSGFLLISKLATLVFGISEQTLRLIPFLSSILAVFGFYWLSKIYLNRKFSIIIANFLFGINYYLIYYSQEFKQYSSDVLIAILLLVLINKLNFSTKTIKQALLLGVFFSAVFWFSFTSIFIFAGLLAVLAVEHIKEYKKTIAVALPFIFNLAFYYIFCAAQNLKYLRDFAIWQEGFISANFSNFLRITVENINYFFYPCKFTLFALVLIVWGAVVLFKESKSRLLTLTIPVFTLVLASYLHFYPIQQRVVLFLIPVLLVLLIKPLDNIKADKKAASLIAIVLAFSYFSKYISPNYFGQIGSESFYKPTKLSEITHLLSTLSDSGDILVLSPSSSAPFEFYSKIYPVKYSRKFVGNMPVYNKDKYFEALDSLPNGNYWFYVAHDVSHSPVLGFIEEWASANCKNVRKYSRGESYLISAQK